MTRREPAGVPVSLALMVVIAASLSGCGYIFGGTTKTISVNSTPSEARLTTEPLTGSFTTPAILELERKHAYTLVVWKEGYEEAQYPLVKKMRVAILIADIILSPSLVPLIVDAATGAWWDLQPERLVVTLRPLEDGLEPIQVTISPTDSEVAPVRVEATESVRVRLVKN